MMLTRYLAISFVLLGMLSSVADARPFSRRAWRRQTTTKCLPDTRACREVKECLDTCCNPCADIASCCPCEDGCGCCDSSYGCYGEDILTVESEIEQLQRQMGYLTKRVEELEKKQSLDTNQ